MVIQTNEDQCTGTFECGTREVRRDLGGHIYFTEI